MKENRKIKYTKKVLSESLIELLKTKHISEITITELCENADINRTTFYRHYEKVLYLLKEIETKLLIDLKSYLKQFHNIYDDYEESLFILEKIFEYIRTHEKTFNVLLGDTGSVEFKKKLVNLFYDQITTIYKVNDDNNKEKLTYILFGSIALVQKWLSKKNQYTNKEMSKFILFFAERILTTNI